MIAALLAASRASDESTVLSDIAEVIGLGAVAGTGISIAFSLMLRGFLIAGAARRDGRKGLALANGAMGAVFAVVCLLAVVVGLLALLHR